MHSKVNLYSVEVFSTTYTISPLSYTAEHTPLSRDSVYMVMMVTHHQCRPHPLADDYNLSPVS